MNRVDATSAEATAMILAILFGAETAGLGDLGTAILGLGGAGGLAGLVGWVLKSALPSLMTMFGEFLDKQNASAKADRDAAAAERAALMEAHHEQMNQHRATYQQLAVNLGTLTATIADLTAEVKTIRAVVGDVPERPVAPEPRPKRGSQ